MQLTDIRTAVRQRIGITSNDGQATNAIVDAMINAAIRRVSVMHDWPWLEDTETFNTVAGTSEYTPGVNWRTTVRLSRADHPDIEYRTPRDIAAYINSSRGAPVLYTVERGKIILAPVPDAVYAITHVFLRNEAMLVNTTDVPLIPDWAVDLVIVTAAHMLAASIKDGALMKLLEPEMGDLYRALKDETRRSRAFGKPKRRKDVWL